MSGPVREDASKMMNEASNNSVQQVDHQSQQDSDNKDEKRTTTAQNNDSHDAKANSRATPACPVRAKRVQALELELAMMREHMEREASVLMQCMVRKCLAKARFQKMKAQRQAEKARIVQEQLEKEAREAEEKAAQEKEAQEAEIEKARILEEQLEKEAREAQEKADREAEIEKARILEEQKLEHEAALALAKAQEAEEAKIVEETKASVEECDSETNHVVSSAPSSSEPASHCTPSLASEKDTNVDDANPAGADQTEQPSSSGLDQIDYVKTDLHESLLNGEEFDIDTGSVMGNSVLTEDQSTSGGEASVDDAAPSTSKQTESLDKPAAAQPSLLDQLAKDCDCDKADVPKTLLSGNEFSSQTNNITVFSMLSRNERGNQKTPSVICSEDSSISNGSTMPEAPPTVILKQPVTVQQSPSGFDQIVNLCEYIKADVNESISDAKEELKELYSSGFVRGLLMGVCMMFLSAATTSHGAGQTIKAALVILAMAPAYMALKLEVEASSHRDPEAEREEEARLAKLFGVDKSAAPSEPTPSETSGEDSSVEEEDTDEVSQAEPPSQPAVVRPPLTFEFVCEYVTTDIHGTIVNAKEVLKSLYASPFVCRSCIATLWMCLVRFCSDHPAGLTVNTFLITLLMATFPVKETAVETAARLEREAQRAKLRLQLEKEKVARARLQLERLARIVEEPDSSVKEESIVVKKPSTNGLTNICKSVKTRVQDSSRRVCEYTKTRAQESFTNAYDYVKTDVEETLVNAQEELEAMYASNFSRRVVIGIFLLSLVVASNHPGMARDVTSRNSRPPRRKTVPAKKPPSRKAPPPRKPPVSTSQPQRMAAPVKKVPAKKPPVSNNSRTQPRKTAPVKKPPASTSRAQRNTTPAKKPPVSTSRAQRKPTPAKKPSASTSRAQRTVKKPSASTTRPRRVPPPRVRQ